MKKLALFLTISTCFASSDLREDEITAREQALAAKREAAEVAKAKALFEQEHTKTLEAVRRGTKDLQKSYTGEALAEAEDGMLRSQMTDSAVPGRYSDVTSSEEALAQLTKDLGKTSAERADEQANLLEKRTQLARRDSVKNLSAIRGDVGDTYRSARGQRLYVPSNENLYAARLDDITEEGAASKTMAAEIRALRKRNSNLEARLELISERMAELRAENAELTTTNNRLQDKNTALKVPKTTVQ